MRHLLLISGLLLGLGSAGWSHESDPEVVLRLRESIWIASLKAQEGDVAGAVEAAELAQDLWCDLSRHARRDILDWYPSTQTRLDELPERAASRARENSAGRSSPPWYPGYRDPRDLFGAVDL